MRAAVVPHAPVLLESATGRPTQAGTEIGEAMAEISRRLDGDVILVSPHCPRATVYAGATGSLSGFGILDEPTGSPTPEAVRDEIEKSWGRGLDVGEVDHGIVVPMRLLGSPFGVVAIGLPESTGPRARPVSEAIDAAKDLADALETVPDRPPLLFSAHTSAALTPAAPLTERAEGRALHERVMGALREDVSLLAAIAADEWEAGGSCGAGPFTALGSLFEGPAHVMAEEEPFGVGYVVASIT